MNLENSIHWLKEKVTDNLKPNSVQVMDNASYHNIQKDKFPTEN